MQIDSFSKGETVEVEVKCGGKIMTFVGEIILIKNNSVLISTIKVNDQTIGFSENCTINFLYKSEGKLFLWEDISVKLVKYDGSIYHKIDILGEGKPYNRRDSYRMYIGEDMPLYVNSSSGPFALSVLVKDISETGLCFITKDEIDIDRTIRLKLRDNSAFISLSGVIVRKEILSNLGTFLYGCRFNEQNNLLGKFLAKRQGEILRKRNTYSSPHSKDKSPQDTKIETIEYK